MPNPPAPQRLSPSGYADVLAQRAAIPDTRRARFRMTSRLNAALVAHNAKPGSRYTIGDWDALLKMTPVRMSGLS